MQYFVKSRELAKELCDGLHPAPLSFIVASRGGEGGGGGGGLAERGVKSVYSSILASGVLTVTIWR